MAHSFRPQRKILWDSFKLRLGHDVKEILEVADCRLWVGNGAVGTSSFFCLTSATSSCGGFLDVIDFIFLSMSGHSFPCFFQMQG